MTLIFIAWIAVAALCWTAYSPAVRILALVSLAVVSTPFLIASTGLAGEGTDDARRMLWILLAFWGGAAAFVAAVRRGL